MRGAADRRAWVNGKEPIWKWFWRCHGWGLVGRVMAVLGALETLGLLGLSLVQAEGALLTFFFILCVMPALLAALVAFALGSGLAVALWTDRERRSRQRREEDAGQDVGEEAGEEAGEDAG
jgi:membrane protein implicated in regulation of membrane protease activity